MPRFPGPQNTESIRSQYAGKPATGRFGFVVARVMVPPSRRTLLYQRSGPARPQLRAALLGGIVDLAAPPLAPDVAHRREPVDLVRERRLPEAEEPRELLLGDPGHLLNRLENAELRLRRPVLEDRRHRHPVLVEPPVHAVLAGGHEPLLLEDLEV